MEGRPAGPARKIAEAIQQGRAEYARMIALLRSGGRLPAETIDGVCLRAAKTRADVVGDVLVGNGPGLRSGDPCPECGGFLVVYSSQRRGASQVQYLRCGQCEYRPKANKRRVPAETVRRRRPRKKPS